MIVGQQLVGEWNRLTVHIGSGIEHFVLLANISYTIGNLGISKDLLNFCVRVYRRAGPRPDC